MSKETREHLSALVDGEISRETSRFLVKRLGTDDELRSTWTRYHLVRDCLRHQDGSIAGDDLSARVSSALENEKIARPAVRRMPARWLKPAAGLAIAASVALMAIVAVGPGLPGVQPVAEELADQAEPEAFTSPQGLTRTPYSSEVSLAGRSNAQDRKMNAYLIRHYQATGAASGKGFVTFVPIVITGSSALVQQDQAEADRNKEDSGDEETTLR
ncbi:MAG: sigma-E factor negative regulatory protein [Xanthomonadales bacterium]|nr:sigma-E factor negative regulatory protein [Gammaproteobacteria bacterium]MBT8053269.1 sigma-E factor negative regulatory protein [Gammaproteobacteria bacterium]NND56036.1 sigma-E factor negative regulatory protein [Xanthomonadales bacterium]NNK50309.1 sigma-E factor negative regulatory protein [Xanthomonadales bacterium]